MPLTSPHLAGLSADIGALATAASSAQVAVTHKRYAASGFYWRPDVVVTVSEGLQVQRDAIVDVHTGTGDKVQGTVKIGRASCRERV